MVMRWDPSLDLALTQGYPDHKLLYKMGPLDTGGGHCGHSHGWKVKGWEVERQVVCQPKSALTLV